MKKTSSTKSYQIIHTPAQRFWGIMALCGLFICGIMTGLTIGSHSAPTPAPSATTVSAPTPVAPTPTVDTPNRPTCEIIQELLTEQLPPADGDTDNRIIRAQIYANLSERGCPENFDAYAALAKQELEIVRALEDDNFDNRETIEVIETYKRLNMQAAAEEIFETAKKLTNPAIDFILQVERIINEQ